MLATLPADTESRRCCYKTILQQERLIWTLITLHRFTDSVPRPPFERLGRQTKLVQAHLEAYFFVHQLQGTFGGH